jgi:catechol 2,3-dioxygenase-like lactoylglutathione lyase family enzyme
MLSRRQIVALLCGLVSGAGYRRPLLAAEPIAVAGAGAIVGIGHIPLAVSDLARATDDYRRLGFAIKPGRYHADGIRTNNIKFADGAGLELITADVATDSLTTRYLQLLAQGEGPAYVGFHTASLSAVKGAVEQLGQAYTAAAGGILEFTSPELQWLFLFEGTNRSPTDLPEHFAHPNTANATLAVWIAGGDQPQMLALFKALGARINQKQVYVPDSVLATVASVANGEVIFLPGNRQTIPGRPIVGVVFQTRDLSALHHTLQSTAIRDSARVETPTYRSIFIAPRDTHGVWLEFREQRQR